MRCTVIRLSACHRSPAQLQARCVRDSETSALIADTVIRNRNDRQYLQRVINDAGKIDEVRNKITEAITSRGRVSPVSDGLQNVNRVFWSGEALIESYPSGRPLAHDRIEVIGDPQMALAGIALYNKED
uniref:StbA protein n=1 Tax=Klebsiella pneumoniae TaxID=573 RepID=A0A2P1BPG8_KLEPN|nr:StbA protein [Klebsiella pneumoniae]